MPILVAKVMTYPERVNRYNIDKVPTTTTTATTTTITTNLQ